MYDFIVVGSGIAGLYVSLLARQHGRVLLLTKAGLDDSNTSQAQGGIAAAVGEGDSPVLHWHDTLIAGAGLSDPAAAWIVAREAPDAIGQLLRFGVRFDREHGGMALAREGAHSRPRVLHAGGDSTGAEIQAALGRLIWQSPNVTVHEHHLVTDLVITGEAVRGVVAVDLRAGRSVRFAGRTVVLATGGAGQLFQHTTNPAVATGTGLALAYRAGVSLADLEFCQFHPTVLLLRNAPRFLISEAVRGEGGILRNADGRRFMFDYHPQGELAPRHVVSHAILTEMARFGTDSVCLDLTHLPAAQVLQRFPAIAAFCRQHDLDITRQQIPVAPAAHYMMGGVRTDLWGQTDLPGLFACGEVACTGAHGANRLASNSLLEALVFGARIVARSVAGAGLQTPETDASPTFRVETLPREWLADASEGEDGVPLATRVLEDRRFGPPVVDSRLHWASRATGREELPTHDARPRNGKAQDVRIEDVQKLMWACAGTSRTSQSLRAAERQLAAWAVTLPPPTAAEEHELRDLILVGQLVVAAALAREETRGAHRRLDFPRQNSAWRRRLVFRHRPTSTADVAPIPEARCAFPRAGKSLSGA